MPRRDSGRAAGESVIRGADWPGNPATVVLAPAPLRRRCVNSRGSDETILPGPEISRKQIVVIIIPIKQRGSIMGTILNAIYRAFLKEFFAENAQDCGRLRGADPSTRRFVLESAFTAHER